MNKILFEEIDTEKIRKFIELPIIHFETNLVNHCNLNCKYCDHMSPIAEKWFADLEIFEKDIRRMAFLFHGEARYIRLVGGEPLLHPRITDFLIITRAFFKNTSIEIWTNGLLLRNMDDKFWKTCKKENIQIHVTKYPLEFDYTDIIATAKKYNITVKFFENGSIVKDFNNNSFDRNGLQDPRVSFINCDNANRHITLSSGGKLFTCDKVSHINILNSKFGTSFQVSEKDFVDIHANITAEEIFRFLARPIPFCRYCNISKRKINLEWNKSEKNITEWVYN